MSRNLVPCEAARHVISRIECEHRALARIIAAMQTWLAQTRDPGVERDYEVFAAMLRYVEEVPDRFHHPQEDAILFPAVRGIPEAAAIVAELEREHDSGATMLQALRRAFGDLRDGSANALNRLSTAIDDFAEFYWAHMRKEENDLLTLAAARLSDDQWRGIEAAFLAAGTFKPSPSGSEEYSRLYRAIAERVDEPLKGYLESYLSRAA
jgi:hemerythrin-like domain-containing protein